MSSYLNVLLLAALPAGGKKEDNRIATAAFVLGFAAFMLASRYVG